ALYTPAWVSATELVSGWMKEAGLLVRRDAVGNVWGRVEGSRGGRAIVTGSHIDTVRGGGALDGALGVVAAVEAVASLVSQLGRPLRILEAVAICEEEGSRFNTNFWGAREMGPPAVATVGTIAVEPAQVNVVPGLARFTVDARHSDNAQRTLLVADITRVCKVAGRERDLSVDVRTLRDRPAVQLNERAA